MEHTHRVGNLSIPRFLGSTECDFLHDIEPVCNAHELSLPQHLVVEVGKWKAAAFDGS